MIRHIKHRNIDFNKYASCINNAEQRKYCATEEYLTICAGQNWDIIVYNDYEAVLPLPFSRKLGFMIIVQPVLCQQLGVFSAIDSAVLNQKFLNFIKAHFHIWYYAFNDKNLFSENLATRKNYVLTKGSYESVFASYSPKRRRKLRLATELEGDIEIKKLPLRDIQSFIFKNFLGLKNEYEKKRFLNIFSEHENAGRLTNVAFYYKGNLSNVVVIYQEGQTAVLLGSYNDRRWIKLGGSSILIDHVIAENIGARNFDFEGSDLPAVEEFVRGFRPVLQPYPVLRYTKKELLLNLLLKR